MEDKQTRLLTLLSVILLALVALIVFVDPPKDKGGGDDEDAVSYDRLWPDAKTDGIKAVDLARADGGVLHLTREDTRWKVAEGDAAPLVADDHKVSTLLDDVLTVEIAKEDTGDAGKAADFGLAPPVAVLTMTAEDGTVYTLRVGRDMPVGYGTYVQKAEGGPISRARTRLSGAIGGGGGAHLADFRDRGLVNVTSADLAAIEIRRPGLGMCEAGAAECLTAPPPLTLRKDDHGWWRDLPSRARVDGDKVDGLLDALDDLKADDFVSGDAANFTPALTVALTTAGGVKTLSFGPEDGGDGRLARAPDQPDAVRVKSKLPEGLTQEPDAWVEGRLLPVRTTTLTKIDLKLGDATLTADRTDNGWSSPAAESELDALEEARVDRTRAVDAASGAAWGQVTLAEGETRQESVKIYQVLPDGGRVAVDEAGGAPFELPAAEIKRLLDGLNPAAAAAAPAGGMPAFDPSMFSGAPSAPADGTTK